MRIHSDENGNGSSKGSDLSQGQIDENHASFHHMNAQISMNAGQNKTGDKRPE